MIVAPTRVTNSLDTAKSRSPSCWATIPISESWQKASPTDIHPPRIQSPGGGAGHSDLPESDGIAERYAALLGSAIPAGAPGHPITRELPARINAAFPCNNPESPPRIQSGVDHPDPPRATQPPDSRSATRAIPTLMGGAGAPDTKQESYSSASILHSSAASRGASLKSDLPITGTAASQSVTPKSGGAVERYAAMGQSATSAGGPEAPGTRKLLVNIHPALQRSISGTRLKSNLPHRRSRPPRSARKRRSRRSARCGWASPRLHRGAPEQPLQRELLIAAILHSCAVSQGGRDLQADFMRLADRCFGPCGTAARRLPGTPVGDTPICVGFRGARRKRSAVDGETWLNPSVTLLGFRVSGNPTSSTLADALSIGGGLVMKQEMNEYFTFDRLYWEIRAVRSGLRTAAGCRSSCGRAARRAQRPRSGSGS